MRNFKTMSRLMFRYDLRDWTGLVFTFLFPVALLLVLVLSMKNSVPGIDLTSQISANVIAFGAAYVGIFAGASHLANWQENGMLQSLRNFPISPNVIIVSQAVVGLVPLIAQALVLSAVGVAMGMTLEPTAILGLIPVILGYFLFFFLGIILAMIVPSIAGVSILASIIILPLGFLGGVMMPIEMLPSWMQACAPYTPLYHMREAISMTLIGTGTWTQTCIGLAYLGLVCIPLGWLSTNSFRWK